MSRDRFRYLAELLDRFAHVPTHCLVRTVVGRGRCWELLGAGRVTELPAGHGADREQAARVCGECPVQHECLELDLRWPGTQPAGVFGALPGEDRRALVPYWRARRTRRGGGGGGVR